MTLRRFSLALLLTVAGGPLAACSGTPQPGSIPWTGLEVAAFARQMLGTPYCYGGVSERGVDCSGLVHLAYREAGITVPRTTGELYRQARKIPLNELLPGDILFFRPGLVKISHVGIYTGDGHFIHAPSSGKAVCIASLDEPYWRSRLVAAGRFGEEGP